MAIGICIRLYIAALIIYQLKSSSSILMNPQVLVYCRVDYLKVAGRNIDYFAYVLFLSTMAS